MVDNVLVGHGPQSYRDGGEGILFGQGAGRGHVAAFNDISLVADGISYGNGNIDIHNNDKYATDK